VVSLLPLFSLWASPPHPASLAAPSLVLERLGAPPQNDAHAKKQHHEHSHRFSHRNMAHIAATARPHTRARSCLHLVKHLVTHLALPNTPQKLTTEESYQRVCTAERTAAAAITYRGASKTMSNIELSSPKRSEGGYAESVGARDEARARVAATTVDPAPRDTAMETIALSLTSWW